jgi:tetratricopeptide (TPR) repeat protein
VRRAIIVGVLASIALASAAHANNRDPAPPARGAAAVQIDFWREVIEPHGVEIGGLLTKATNALRFADEATMADGDWSVTDHMRYFVDVYNIMKYARALAPDNAEVLATFARAADELGRTHEAREAWAHYMEVADDRLSADAIARYGSLLMRSGERDAAIAVLRNAQGPVRSSNASAQFLLANALAERGEISAALDVLEAALPSQIQYYSGDVTLLTFAQAVILDEDEQRSAAFETLDRAKSAMSSSYGTSILNALATIRFAPSEDQHYYLGLLYESQHEYVEARAEFALYAAVPDAVWRTRALDHVHAIDAERRVPKPPAQKKTATPPSILVPVP